MARKNLLTGLTERKATEPGGAGEGGEAAAPLPPRSPSAGFAGRGAFGAVTRTIDGLAARADAARALEDRLAAGEVVVELDPALIDRSFITDRMEMDDEHYRTLRDSIAAEGQATPILVRPNGARPGHYQVAFGHRRLKAAMELGRPVRAIVKRMSDRDLVIAQGQENSARADLSFIERARFAQMLEEREYDRPTICTALSTDKTTLSRMIGVVNKLPLWLIVAAGPARSAGRDRWQEVAQAFASARRAEIEALIAREDFMLADTEERFGRIHALVTESGRMVNGKAARTKPDRPSRDVLSWGPEGESAFVKGVTNGNVFTLTIDRKKAPLFGDYLMAQLEKLYEGYLGD